jgi:hypothetical protein
MQTNGNGLSGDEHVRASQKAADARVRVALRLIEEAQGLLDQACQALCSVSGMYMEWRKVGRVGDQAKASWYAVEKKAKRLEHEGRLVLDHEPDTYEAHWTRLLEEGGRE